MQCYRKHNQYVKSRVPKENLLIWNLKDGWGPICNFLKVPIPEHSMPHENKTGDLEYIQREFIENQIIADSIKQLGVNLGMIVIFIGILYYFLQ